MAVIPAEAGFHKLFREIPVDSRVRGEDKGVLMFLFQKCVTPVVTVLENFLYTPEYFNCVIIFV